MLDCMWNKRFIKTVCKNMAEQYFAHNLKSARSLLSSGLTNFSNFSLGRYASLNIPGKRYGESALH